MINFVIANKLIMTLSYMYLIFLFLFQLFRSVAFNETCHSMHDVRGRRLQLWSRDAVSNATVRERVNQTSAKYVKNKPEIKTVCREAPSTRFWGCFGQVSQTAFQGDTRRRPAVGSRPIKSQQAIFSPRSAKCAEEMPPNGVLLRVCRERQSYVRDLYYNNVQLISEAYINK